ALDARYFFGSMSVIEAEEKPQRSFWRRLRHRLRPLVSRPLLALALAVVPRLYVAYMWLVWRTSKVEDRGFARPPGIRDEHDGFVGLLWHEEVFSVAYAYRTLHPHTLASAGGAGALIATLLRLAN